MRVGGKDWVNGRNIPWMLRVPYLDSAVSRIIETFDPLQVVLFGSHARGEADDDSDIDLLVVLPTVEPWGSPLKAMTAVRRVLRRLPICIDVIVTTPEHLATRARIPGSVIRNAIREGKPLYARE